MPVTLHTQTTSTHTFTPVDTEALEKTVPNNKAIYAFLLIMGELLSTLTKLNAQSSQMLRIDRCDYRALTDDQIKSMYTEAAIKVIASVGAGGCGVGAGAFGQHDAGRVVLTALSTGCSGVGDAGTTLTKTSQTQIGSELTITSQLKFTDDQSGYSATTDMERKILELMQGVISKDGR